MGLDMYLDKYPKLGIPLKTLESIEGFLKWKEGGYDKKFTLKKWGGINMDDLPTEEMLEFIKKYRRESYWAWDVDHRCPPHKSFHENVGYWRKANQVHRWFEDHIGDDGDIENCENYLVTEDDLEKLLQDCKTILENTVLVNGTITNGYRLSDKGEWEPVLQQGLVVSDSKICEELMPTESGFFFGSTDYDEYYIEDLKYTYEMCSRVLKETDFNESELYYYASW